MGKIMLDNCFFSVLGGRGERPVQSLVESSSRLTGGPLQDNASHEVRCDRLNSMSLARGRIGTKG